MGELALKNPGLQELGSGVKLAAQRGALGNPLPVLLSCQAVTQIESIFLQREIVQGYHEEEGSEPQ